MSTRLQRVEQVLRREIADVLLRGGLRDPRLRDTAAISITGVRVSADLGSARVFVDVLSEDLDIDQVVRGLNGAASVFRGELGRRIRLKRTPALRFERDESIRRGQAIEKVLQEIREQSTSTPDDEVG